MKQYRVVVKRSDDTWREIGNPPYDHLGTAVRVKSLWRNYLKREGVVDPQVKVQQSDVAWEDL